MRKYVYVAWHNNNCVSLGEEARSFKLNDIHKRKKRHEHNLHHHLNVKRRIVPAACLNSHRFHHPPTHTPVIYRLTAFPHFARSSHLHLRDPPTSPPPPSRPHLTLARLPTIFRPSRLSRVTLTDRLFLYVLGVLVVQ